MTTKKCLTFAAAALAASVSLASAQNAEDHAAHHPAAQTATQAQTSATQAAPSGAAGSQGMMGGQRTTGSQGMTGGKGTVSRQGMMGSNMAGMMAMMQGGMPDCMGGFAGPFGHVDGQLAYLKAELHLTDAQLPKWNAFAAAFRSHVAQLQAVTTKARQATGTSSAPAQLERGITVMTARLDTMRAVLEAAKPLYAVLTDDQKRTADELVTDHMVAMRASGL